MPPIDGLQRHLAERLDVVRQQQRRAPRSARCRERSLGAGVAASDDNDVKPTRVLHKQGTIADTGAILSRRGQRQDSAVWPIATGSRCFTWNISGCTPSTLPLFHVEHFNTTV